MMFVGSKPSAPTGVAPSAAMHPVLFVVLAYVISWAWAPALKEPFERRPAPRNLDAVTAVGAADRRADRSGRGPHRRRSPTRRGRGTHPASTKGT